MDFGALLEPNFEPFFGPFRALNFPVYWVFCVPRVVFEPVLDRLCASLWQRLRSTFAPVSRLIWAGFFNDRNGSGSNVDERHLLQDRIRLGQKDGSCHQRDGYY